MSVRMLLVGEEESLGERMRRRRWRLLMRHVPGLAELRVVDLGGTAVWWSRAPVKPRHVTVVNLHEAGEDAPGVTAIEGDALSADELLRGENFDLVFSNSLIEHLGGHGPRSRLAEVVASLAPLYVIQTPYRYFPIEPHWMFPGFQFLPVSARSYLAPRWTRRGRRPMPRIASTPARRRAIAAMMICSMCGELAGSSARLPPLGRAVGGTVAFFEATHLDPAATR